MTQRVRGSKLPRNIHAGDGTVDVEAMDENLREIERLFDETDRRRSDVPPEVELVLDQIADMLSMVVLVNDVGNNWEGYVRFKKLSGPGDLDITDPTDGSWTTDAIAPFAETVTLEAKHGGIIAAAVPFRRSSTPAVLEWVIKTHRGDADVDAELTGHDVAFDTNGYPIVNLTGDEDARKHYLIGAVGADIAAATPADPSAVSKDATLATREGYLKLDGTGGTTARQTKMGELFGYKVACENKFGVVNTEIFGPYFRRRGDSKTTQPRVHAVGVRVGSTVTVTLLIDDPSKAVAEPQYQVGSLGGSWITTWDSATGTAGTATALSRVKGVSSAPGLSARFGWRVPWTDELGVTQYIGDEIDLADLDQVTKQIEIGSSGFTPIDNTQTYSAAGGLLIGTTPGVMSLLIKGPPVVRGTILTGMSVVVYRNVAGDAIEVDFGSYATGSFVATTVATFVGSAATPGFETISASFLESAADTASRDYELLVASTPDGGGAGVPGFRSALLTYAAPSYDKTY